MELQESSKELRHKHDRQIKLLSDQNNALQAEIERLSRDLDKVSMQNRNHEDELSELKERKDSVQQWESQVAEIIQW